MSTLTASISPILHVVCKGSPNEIGFEHGRAAASRVHGSIAFYASFFATTARLQWPAVLAEAQRWLPYLEVEWPHYVEEMRALAQGADVPFADILALNVRTEIAYGLMAPVASDGCTALAYYPRSESREVPGSNNSSTARLPIQQAAYLAQNWDWEAAQAPNLIRLTILRGKDNALSLARRIDMITEAGIIGKIGLSSTGVGVCLNAVRAPGVSYAKLPVHLALRAVLDGGRPPKEDSQGEAHDATNGTFYQKPDASLASRLASMLQGVGVASAAHILIADSSRAVGLETSCVDTARVDSLETPRGTLLPHTNHYLCPHGASDKAYQWTDSVPRLRRIEDLVRRTEAEMARTDEPHALDAAQISGWLQDEDGYPVSILRDRTPTSASMTLFGIVMSVHAGTALVRMGRKASEESRVVRLSVRDDDDDEDGPFSGGR